MEQEVQPHPVITVVPLDKPEFLKQKPPVCKTSPQVNKGLVMSEITGASNELSTAKGLQKIGTQGSRHAMGIEPIDIPKAAEVDTSELTSSISTVEEQKVDPLSTSIPSVSSPKYVNFQSSGVSLDDKNKSLLFSLGNSASNNRSSIYESKSTVTAIPIRSTKTHDFDDIVSNKSVSSSLTASFSRNFLYGFYNDRKRGQLRNRGILSKDYWMKDESAKECFACAKAFSTFRRKHHCRICGQIFCSSCTFLMHGDKFGHSGKMRICNNCYEHANNYEDSSDESSIDDASHIDQVSTSQVEPINGISNDDIQSILTTGGDESRIFITPTPPPKMAIPATRQGESLEISFPSGGSNTNFFPHYSHHPNRNYYGMENPTRPRRGTRDRYSLRDVEILSPITQEPASANFQNSLQRSNTSIRSLQLGNIRHSLSNYINGHNGSVALTLTPKQQQHQAPMSIFGNLGHNNFKFEFNYGVENHQKHQSQKSPSHQSFSNSRIPSPQIHEKSEDEGSEDEGSMSLYSALNETRVSEHNPIRSLRNNRKSSQRAQASLQRMRMRRKSRSKSVSVYSTVAGKDLSLLNCTSPNLISVVTSDNNYATRSNDVTNYMRPRLRSEILNSKELRRVISSSACFRLLPKEGKSELSEVSTLHINALLKQVVIDQELPTSREWEVILTPFLLKIQAIHLDARKLDDLDFKQHYLKIKRIAGGHISDSELVHGVVYSKGLPLKSMPREMHAPRILVIMFPVEYQKNDNQLLSLASVMAQEKEYLNKLVLRLTSLSPDIILAGSKVSGYALKLLCDAGIVVQYNLKPQVIERISKFTESDIAISVDKLATNIKLGTCAKFEVKTYIYDNISRTYTFLTGCKPSLGATIVLRGETHQTLRKIKDVTEFMVYAVFCLRLESSFLNDSFLQFSPGAYKQMAEKRRNSAPSGYFSEFIEKFNSRLFSVSPMVEFPVPYLLAKARELEAEISKKSEQISHILQSGEEPIQDIVVEGLDMNILKRQDYNYLVKFIHEKELKDLQLKFQRRKRQWEVSYSLSQNLLGTGSHQNITVLYSVISSKTATPCIGPQLVTIDYFWDNDISVGQFIENVVATACRPCGHSCGGLMIDHYRSYVHGNGKVDVLVEKFQSKIPMQNIIFTWSYCKKCSSTTPTLQLSDRSWNYSLGKYLELLFWNSHGFLPNAGNCSHDFSRDHIKYFRLNDSVVRMEYSEIDVHELIIPSTKITWSSHIDIKLKVESYYSILDKINKFYFSVSDRLNRVKLDSLPEERLQSGQARIMDLKAKVEEEKTRLIKYTDELYRDTPGDQHLHINAAIRALHNNAAGWDAEFVDFEKKFLPTDKDIARITALQLKKLLVDFKRSDEKGSLDCEKERDMDMITDIPEEGETIDESKESHGDDDEGRSDADFVVQKSRKNSHDSNTIESQNSASSIGNMNDTEHEQMFNSASTSKQMLRTTEEALKFALKDERRRGRVLGEAFKFEEMIKQTSDSPTVKPNATSAQAPPILKYMNSSGQITVESNASLHSEAPDNNSNNNNTITNNNSQSRDSRSTIRDRRNLSMSSSNSSITQRSRDCYADGKVGQLASFFDQIHFDALSKEFELQREMERLQMNKNKYKAIRVKSSTPIVEVYKNVIDAVDGPMNEETKLASRISASSTVAPNQNSHSELGMASPDAFVAESNLRRGLETELENSIHMWSERVLLANEDKDMRSKDLLATNGKNTQNEPLPPVTTPANVNMDNSDAAAPSEKLSLMKTLANFWADRSATSWKPLEYPTTQTEHIFMDNDVIIREDEPSSLIAFCLSCSDYVKKMNNMSNQVQQRESEVNPPKAKKMTESESYRSIAESTTEDGTTEADLQVLMKISEPEPLDLEKIMTKKTGMHLRYQFQDGSSVMSCKIFFFEQFEAFRRKCGCSDGDFIQSLSRCVKWDSSGGKSGSAFLKTLDDRFVLKELSRPEIDAFVKFAPSYFEYMGQALFHDLPTALAKIFGFFQIQIRNSATGKSFKMDVIIMENLFYDKKTTRIFDLKGTMRNRHVQQTGRENEVLLDENMVEYIYESPIFVREYDKKLLRASLWNDTLFLAKMNVMDYSLVIGVDNENHNLTVGIIDCIRTFTWDKKLESWVKEKGLVGGNTKQPTIVTPRQYKNRFREAMERYILMVPDPWYQETRK
ncbi:HGL187Wp [Eremothecium sinecaudum]|uniref:1-phosphatidylinositol-3-phosphate 5-kinase n=1 Tax=Eremothecium sinecaudum TaxID=45286 RepID=A0A109V082_9SACH|nr:HGL187Wp [Eremothecium sinecaudum]AMD22153.1 HGL187Wp [Eremothecium sinecaudum]